MQGLWDLLPPRHGVETGPGQWALSSSPQPDLSPGLKHMAGPGGLPLMCTWRLLLKANTQVVILGVWLFIFSRVWFSQELYENLTNQHRGGHLGVLVQGRAHLLASRVSCVHSCSALDRGSRTSGSSRGECKQPEGGVCLCELVALTHSTPLTCLCPDTWPF